MAARKRIAAKPIPDFRIPKEKETNEEHDLKKVKEQALKNIEENKKNEQAWYDTELEKNMKKQ